MLVYFKSDVAYTDIEISCEITNCSTKKVQVIAYFREMKNNNRFQFPYCISKEADKEGKLSVVNISSKL